MKKTTYNHQLLERFIPVAYDELFEDAVSYLTLDSKELETFSFTLQKVFHLQFHEKLKRLKKLYFPFNPDSDTLSKKTYKDFEYKSLENNLISEVKVVLNDANYEELTQKKLLNAMNAISPYGVEVSVDFEDFNQIVLFYRGEAVKSEYHRTLKSLYIKKERIDVNIYRRLFILLKPKTLEECVEELYKKEGGNKEKLEKKVRKNRPILLNDSSKQKIYIKLFKDIPHADLEMLFLIIKVKISFKDKLKIGVTGGGGTIGASITFIGKLSLLVDPVSLLVALGAFGGVILRQVKTIFTHQTRYMAALAKNLYFYNLDNNAGVLSYMVDLAESEESKEALLAYLFLYQSKRALTREELDAQIEAYMLKSFSFPMDFEVDDGVAKLLVLGILKEENGYLHVASLDEANCALNSLI